MTHDPDDLARDVADQRRERWLAQCKPCPWRGCGSSLLDLNDDAWEGARVVCKSCGCKGPPVMGGSEMAVEAWNNRAEVGR